jgi:hypothetical protein
LNDSASLFHSGAPVSVGHRCNGSRCIGNRCSLLSIEVLVGGAMAERGWKSIASYWLALAVLAAVIVCVALFLHPSAGAAGGCGGG